MHTENISIIYAYEIMVQVPIVFMKSITICLILITSTILVSL